ncbi:Thioredoxin-like protein AAED1, protein [Acrodontium crateriforme]|uniref:Thioredoxin-like protein AAED1, protein n=1 Tax=Acrodontium crateriforme TaxID=150365 RepID=A0AAQ3RAK3_9PEZI|nr:Thioredoxin-like protein AAED1, protein [Acrodontium crateriforme]
MVTTAVRPRLITITAPKSVPPRRDVDSFPDPPATVFKPTRYNRACPSTPPPPPPISKMSPTTPTSVTTHASLPSFSSSAGQSYDTAATSVNDSVVNVKSHDQQSSLMSGSVCTFHQDHDDWSAQFRSDLDLGSLVSDDCPDGATLAAVHDIPIYNAEGEARSFGSLFDPDCSTHQRQLIIFVRHFYCGACQAYIKAMAEGIPSSDYFSIPVPTNFIVIGCGQPHLIPQYKKFSQSPFPIFADPSRKLFKTLGMSITLNIGKKRPDYMKDISPVAWAHGQATTIRKSLKDEDGIRKRDIVRGGHPMQIGGEFLFDEGEVVWCHRMRNMRDHTEISVLRKLLEIDEG